MNYLQLQEQIAYVRLNRPDLLQPVPPSPVAIIPTYVQDRITFYQKELFVPSEQLDYSITTTRAMNTYKMPKGMQALRQVRLLLNTIWIPLTRADFFWDMLQADVLNPPLITIPSYWRQFGQSFRLYPTPNIAYPLELLCNESPPAPVNDADENFWTQEAATCIMEAACEDICRNFTNDEPRAQKHGANRAREAVSLQQYTIRIAGPTQIRSYL